MLKLPPEVPKELEKLVTDYMQRLSEQGEARRTLRQREAIIGQAKGRDQNALAEALESGKPDPGPKHLEKAEDDIAEAERRDKALHQVVTRIENDITATLAEHRAKWLGQVEKDLDKTDREYHAALKKMAVLHNQRRDLQAYRTWIKSGKYKAPIHPLPEDTSELAPVIRNLFTEAGREQAIRSRRGPSKDPRETLKNVKASASPVTDD